MDKHKLIELFEEVLKDWERAQGYVIDGGGCDYTHDELETDIVDYRQKFYEALGS